MKEYSLTIEKINDYLSEHYIHWSGDVFTREDSLLPVVKVIYDDESSERMGITVQYGSDLSCSKVFKTETFINPNAEAVIDAVNHGMYEEDWFSFDNLYNSTQEDMLITPVDTFLCNQLGIRELFSIQSIKNDLDLPNDISSNDLKVVIISIPVAIRNTRNRSKVLFFRKGILEGDDDSIQLKRIRLTDKSIGLFGIKDGYAFVMAAANPEKSKSISFKYGLLNRGIKAIIKDNSVDEVYFRVAWIKMSDKNADYKNALKALISFDISKWISENKQPSNKTIDEGASKTIQELPDMTYFWRWCLIGNIVNSNDYGDGSEVRYGVDHFPEGTRVYIAPAQWLDGFKNVVVIGRSQYENKFIEAIIPSKNIENYRVKKEYDPKVLELMSKSQYEWWNDTNEDYVTIDIFSQCMNGDSFKNEEIVEFFDKLVIVITIDGLSIWGFMTMGDSAYDSDSGEDEVDINRDGNYISIPISKVKYVSPLDEITFSILGGQPVENPVPDGSEPQNNDNRATSILKTFYSKDKKCRAHIHRRDDGLIDVLSDELEYVYSMDEYVWYSDEIAMCITDSIKIAEDEILRDFHYEYIEAPIVDIYDRVTLKDGRQGAVVEITSDGDYIVELDPGNSEECISIEEIAEAHFE